MSERAFFALRYALPGYTLILMSILIASPRLTFFLQQLAAQEGNVELVGVFLAFLALLGGAPIGFLVSQGWYVIYNSRFMRGKSVWCPSARRFLREIYHLTEDRHRQIIFLDYVIRLSDKKWQTYVERRYDLLQTIGSTLFALGIGSIFGLSARILSYYDIATILFKSVNFKSLISYLLKFDYLGSLTIFDAGILLIFLFLFIVLSVGLRRVIKELAMAVDISAREVVNMDLFPLWKARELFTEEYFNKR